MDQNEVQKVNGTWQGIPVNIKKVWGANDHWEGHEFTADECTQLFNDETIEFDAISKAGKPYTAKGKLEKQSYEDSEGKTHEYVGFTLKFDNANSDIEYFEGVWNNHNVKIKRVWGKNDHWDGHRFTDSEIEALLNNETIEFEAVSKNNSAYTAKGKLEEQEYNNSKFIGLKLIFN